MKAPDKPKATSTPLLSTNMTSEPPMTSSTFPQTSTAALFSSLTSTLPLTSSLTASSSATPVSTVTVTPISTVTVTPMSTVTVTPVSTVTPTSTVTPMSTVTPTSVTPTSTLASTATSTCETTAVADNWADMTSRFDSQQLKFELGPCSKSPGKIICVKSPTNTNVAPPRPTAGTSNSGLFGSDIVTEAFHAPCRYNFKGTSPQSTSIQATSTKITTIPISTQAPSSSSEGPRRKAPDATSRGSGGSSVRSLPGTSRQAATNLTIRKLGPDVVIRPVSIANRNKTSFETSRQNAGLKETDTNIANRNKNSFEPISRQNTKETDSNLLAGYQCLKEEVASLKVQLASSQALMQEILTNFSSEIARINFRLTSIEQSRTEEKRIQERQVQEVKKEQEKEDENEECLDMLGKLDLTKESSDK